MQKLQELFAQLSAKKVDRNVRKLENYNVKNTIAIIGAQLNYDLTVSWFIIITFERKINNISGLRTKGCIKFDNGNRDL